MATTVKGKKSAAAEKPNYRTRKDEVPTRRARPSSAANESVILASQRIYGHDTSIMFADRGPGYHTRPHQHDAEQMNYMVSGEIWFYVGGRGYRCKRGDIMRIPKNKVHWAWNRGTEPAVIIETHCPPLIGNDAEARTTAVPLLGPDEDKEKVPYVVNKVVPMDPKEVAAIELRAWEEEG
jgi:mannose-6-phosphate isomerase-like protein (cupin superfamily)